METVINIKVFDPTWLEKSAEIIKFLKEIKEPEDIDAMKYQEGICFDFGFDILDHVVSYNTNHEISLLQNNKVINVILENILLVSLKGQDKTKNVIISSNLLYGNFEAKKSGGKQYMYFYLDGNHEYIILSENIWLALEVYTDLCAKYPNSSLNTDIVHNRIYRGRNQI